MAPMASIDSDFREKLEHVLLRISTEFINLPLASLDHGLVDALSQLGTLAEAECCQIFIRHTEQNVYLPRVVWRHDNSETSQPIISRLDMEKSAPLFQALADDGFFSSSSRHAAIVNDASTDEMLQHLRRGSALTVVPLNARNQTAGLLIMQAKQAPSERLKDNMPLVQVLAQIFGNLLDRKSANDELISSRERMGAIIASLDDMIWSGDPNENKLIFMSPAAEKIYGRPLREFEDDPELWRKVVHPDDVHQIGNYMADLKRNGVARKEYRILRSDGTVRWVSDRASIAKDENGRHTRIDGILSDITEQKRAEQALIQSQQHLQSIVQGVPIILFAINAAGVFTLADGRGLRSLAMRARDVLGKHVSEVFRDSQEMLRNWNRALEGAAFVEVIFHGGYFFEMRFSPVKKMDGTIEGAVAVGTDVSARESAQVALRESEDRFRRLAGATSEGVAILRHGVLIDVNEMLCNMFGYTRAELIGKSTLDLIAPASRKAVENREQRDESGSEILGLRRDLTTFPIEISERTSTVDTAHSRVLVIRDITIQARALEEYRRAKDVAEQTAHLKSEFLANMSHEIRTPLHVVLSMAELLAHSTLDAEQREYLQKIDASGRALLELINDILDFSKIEAGKLEIESVSFQLPDVFAELTDLQEARAHSKGLEFSSEIDSEIPRYLSGDPGRLRQVLLNLISNAIKFTQRGAVRITAKIAHHADDGQASVRFSVLDTGVGIPTHLQDRLFKTFSQVDASTTRKYGGTGLGLVISRAIIDAMGGTIEVHSREGAGSEFAFTIPFKLGTPTAPSAEIGISPATPLFTPGRDHDGHKRPPHRILVVEDNAVNQFVAQRMLKNLGYDIDIANNGRDALEILQTRSYDLIFMDCQMPEMDGYETTRLIRHMEAGKRSVPIIAMTANAMKGDAEKCLEAGMDAYLSKPVSLDALRSALKTHLRSTPANIDSPKRPPSDAAPVTLDRIRTIFGDDIEAQKKFAELFLTEFTRRHASLRDHLREGNFEKIGNIAHALKGSSGNVGANNLMQMMNDLGQAARQSHPAKCTTLLDAIDQESRRVLDFLQTTFGIAPPKPEST